MLLTDPETDEPGINRFMSSQAIMLSLKGIPGVYFHSLFGTQNDVEAAEQSQIPRRINRRKFDATQLSQRIRSAGTIPQLVFSEYRKLLHIRRLQSAFHPEASQTVIDYPNNQLLVFQRLNHETREQVTVVANFSETPHSLQVDRLPAPDVRTNLIKNGQVVENGRITVPPYGTLWLR